ncbi:MAG TPA: NAD(P)H-hydrate dehydratase [Verrucomicrobiae bacterium]|nr:NAD(P)H-hydrate dehydratase [Verrucomicrobiae bacterium]
MSVPVITVPQMREWESATWAAGQTEAEVIRRVGKRLGRRVRKLTGASAAILILAGKGNNGADARAMQEFLDERKTEILDVTAPATDLPKFQELLKKKFALIVDGLFGIGLNRPLDEDWQKFIAAVNASKIPILAVDVPSGLNGETGEPMGAAIEAVLTLTVAAPKAGMLAPSAWPYVGRLEVLDSVGLIPCPLKSELNWTERDDFQDFPPRRPVAAHKGSFGHLAIVAGSLGYHGASVLASRGAQRAQPGLITVFTQESIYHPVAAQMQGAMVNLWKPDTKAFEKASAILFGPGLAAPELPDEMKLILRRLWRDFPHPLVVDASALDWLAAHALPKNLVRIVTPHPGEAARMINSTAQKVQMNRIHAVREISQRYGNCWVVLKGHQTLVGRSEGEIHVNSSGNPHLAQGGSGDVLSGFIAGFLAQPALQADAGLTIRHAVWRHGDAADELQAAGGGWVVEDLIKELGNPP